MAANTGKSTLTPVVLVFVFALLIIGGSLLLGLAWTTPPRGFTTQAVIGYICWFEFVFAMLVGHFLWVRGQEKSVSGAMMDIVFKVAGSTPSVYALDGTTGAKKWEFKTGYLVLLPAPSGRMAPPMPDSKVDRVLEVQNLLSSLG